MRQIGAIEGNSPTTDNDWSTITRGGDETIKRWIARQLAGRSCTVVVMVGQQTANRKWINHEIVESWNRGMGVVGIRIHGLKNFDGFVSSPGPNPFDFITHGPTGRALSTLVRCYEPAGIDSRQRYAWIAKYLRDAVEEAAEIRNKND